MGKKPVLVVMAAGMGSRYGGLKQIDPVGNGIPVDKQFLSRPFHTSLRHQIDL